MARSRFSLLMRLFVTSVKPCLMVKKLLSFLTLGCLLASVLGPVSLSVRF